MKLDRTKDRKNLPLEGGKPQFHGPYPNSRCQPTRQKNCTRGSPKHGNSSSSCNSWRPSKPSATAQPSALICPPASFASPSQTWKTIPSASRSCDSPGIASLTSWGFPQTSRSLFRPATGRATGFRAMCPGLPKLGEGPGSGAAPPRLTGNAQRPLGTPPRGPLLEGPRCARSTRKGGGVLQTNAQLKEAMGECLGQLAPWEVFATWTFSRPVRETGAAYWACRHLASLEDATNGWGLARPTAANGHGYIQDGQLDLPRTRVYLPSGGWREAQVGGLVHLQALVGNLGQLVKFCGERLLTTEWGRDCCLIHRWPAGYARVFPYDPHRGAKFYVSKYITKRLAEWDLVGFPVPMPAP